MYMYIQQKYRLVFGTLSVTFLINSLLILICVVTLLFGIFYWRKGFYHGTESDLFPFSHSRTVVN